MSASRIVLNKDGSDECIARRAQEGREARRIAGALLIAALLAGCGITGTSPEPRFYTLASQAPPPAPASAAGFTIVVGPVTVPDVVDRPQMVTRTAENRVEIDEQARWAAPLKSEIARVIADRLAALLQGARVSTMEQRATGAPDYRLVIDVQRFDSSAEGATVQAAWSMRTKDNPTATAGRSLVTEPAGAGYDALVAAHSRALAKIAEEIAAAIQTTRK
jgi:uncharacterized lipoprotein YmbA